MKTLFEQEGAQEVIARIDSLQPTSTRQWGKMDVAQMMAHCYEKPFSKSSPTDKQLVVTDVRDFAREKESLKTKVRQFHEGGEAMCTRRPHPFFGAITPQDWSRGMYKH